MFLVASEPFQEAQQEQDPSTPAHSPHPAASSATHPGPAFHSHTLSLPPAGDCSPHLQKCHRAPRAAGDITHLMGMEGGCWQGTSRAGFGHFCSLLECPDQAWLFPAGQTEVEELKLVQDPALASPGSEGRSRSRTWGFSASLEASQAKKWGENSRKGTELDSVRIREWGRWGEAGRKQQGCGNSWPWSARTHQGLQGIHLQAGTGLTTLRASSDLGVWNCPGCSRSRGSSRDGRWLMPGAKWGKKPGIETITGGRVWLQPVQP